MDEKQLVFLIVKYGSIYNAYREWMRNRWDLTSTPADDKYMREWADENLIYHVSDFTSAAAKHLADRIDNEVLKSLTESADLLK